jgi:hypothetical protein
MLREAGRPMSIGEMAIAALAAKGERFPDRRTRRITRTVLRYAMNRFAARGLVRSVGTGKATRRMLIQG